MFPIEYDFQALRPIGRQPHWSRWFVLAAPVAYAGAVLALRLLLE